ncbi:acyltransferase [Desulfotignum balticum]|uniref:acyltransferase n=1 Tax=Desulfotignum balticum TaxID=115781 RepID=UPI000462BBAE|nr:acyltransferase [Desulfotignum balticum]
MKTGLGLKNKIRSFNSKISLLRFFLLRNLFGFDAANVYLQQLDKSSLQYVLRKNGATIGKNCDIETGLIFHNCKNYSNLIVGNNCHVGKNCFFDLKEKVIIENNVVISMQTTFITHQDMNKSDLKNYFPSTQSKIVIKKNCYIGAKVTILKGTIINDFSMVGAGSVVTKEIPKFSIYAGVPAKFVKKVEKESTLITKKAF